MDVQSQVLADDLVGNALRGPHRHLAVGDGPARAYRPDVSAFASLGPDPDGRAWAALSALPIDVALLVAPTAVDPGPGWARVGEIPVVRMVDGGGSVEPGGGSAPLTTADVPAVLDLVARTEPGPFLAGTLEMGGYRGVRRDGVLAAMAGRRMHPPGWIEVSAVCTDPAYRGQGLAALVVRDVLAGIRAEGARGFLHVSPANPRARAVYERLGFVELAAVTVTRLARAA